MLCFINVSWAPFMTLLALVSPPCSSFSIHSSSFFVPPPPPPPLWSFSVLLPTLNSAVSWSRSLSLCRTGSVAGPEAGDDPELPAHLAGGHRQQPKLHLRGQKPGGADGQTGHRDPQRPPWVHGRHVSPGWLQGWFWPFALILLCSLWGLFCQVHFLPHLEKTLFVLWDLNCFPGEISNDAHEQTAVWIFHQGDWCVVPVSLVITGRIAAVVEPELCLQGFIIPDFIVKCIVGLDLFVWEINPLAAWNRWNTTVIQFLFGCSSNLFPPPCRPSHGDPVHRTSLRPGGREGHLHLSGHREPSHHWLQVWITFYQNFPLKVYDPFYRCY